MKATPDSGSGLPRRTHRDRQRAEARLLQGRQLAAAGAEGLQLITVSDRRTRQLERRQDRDLQRTEAPRLLRDKQLATAVWASIRAGKGPARTKRVARRERQILNLCVFHLYRDMILREFPSYQSIRGEFPFVAPGASATGTMVGTHTRRSIHAPRKFVWCDFVLCVS